MRISQVGPTARQGLFRKWVPVTDGTGHLTAGKIT